MGSRSKQTRRAVPTRRVQIVLDHHRDQRAALDFVLKQPGCTVEDLAADRFAGSRAVAFSALNALRNKGYVIREENKFHAWNQSPTSG